MELTETFLPLEKCMFKNKAYASEAGSCRQDVREQWPQAWMQPCLKSNARLSCYWENQGDFVSKLWSKFSVNNLQLLVLIWWRSLSKG